MWWQPNKPAVERSALIAIIGGVAALIFIAVITFGVQHWPLWKHTYTLDQYAPHDVSVYLHVDLSRRQMKRWDTERAMARWSTVMTALEDKLKSSTASSTDALEMAKYIGTEIAFVQLTVANQPENVILIKTKSADKFEAALRRAVPSHLLPQEKNVWISDDASDLFSLASMITPQFKAAARHVYWTNIDNGIYILSSTPKFILDAKKNDGKYRNTIGDAMAGYRTGAPLISGFLPLESIWSATQTNPDLKEYSTQLGGATTEPVYVELNADNDYVWGQIRNYSQRLFDRLSTSDAETLAMGSRLNPPTQYRLAYLHLPLGKILEQLTGSGEKAAPLQSWVMFAKQQLGADWDKEIAPIVDTPADLILGTADDTKKSTPFLLALLPTSTDTLNNQLNNLEALFRRLAGQLYPREVPTTLIDGTQVTELVPDPQTNAWRAWTGEGSLESFQIMDLPTGGQLLLGRLNGQNIITNSTELLKTVAQPKPSLEINTGNCLSRIHGNELVVVPGSGLLNQTSLINKFESLYLANGSDGNRISLMFCLMLPRASQ